VDIAEHNVNPELTRRILGSAIDVHRVLGPGLLESTYRTCLTHRLSLDGMKVEQEVAIPIRYLDLVIDHAFRADLVVEKAAIIEVKAVERLLPIHEAQLLTYMKLARLPLGLLMNFNVARLVSGIRRLVNPDSLVAARSTARCPKPEHAIGRLDV
jgi:GxxExxY protein